MTGRITVRDVLRGGPGRVRLAGWVFRVRRLGGIVFLELRDRTGTIQVIARRGSPCFEDAKKIDTDYVVVIQGEAREEPRAPGGVEVVAERISVIAKAEKPLPLDYMAESPPDRRFKWRFLDLRNPSRLAVLRAVSEVAHAASEYFRRNGFVQVFSPKIIGQASEGGADAFPLVYFGREAFLAQSPQLYKQLMMLTGVERVYEIGPAFRAEMHRGPRHLCEFRSIDFEMSFPGSLEEVYGHVVGVVREAINAVYNNLGEDLGLGEKPRIPGNPPVLDYDEACQMIGRRERCLKSGEDEALLGKLVLEEYDSEIVVVTGYPWAERPFYTMRDPGDPGKTLSFDVLLRGMEIASGGFREHRYDILKAQIREKGLNPASFSFYLEHFKYGMPPHGGAGIGLERLTARILGIDSVREAAMAPRDPERLVP